MTALDRDILLVFTYRKLRDVVRISFQLKWATAYKSDTGAFCKPLNLQNATLNVWELSIFDWYRERVARLRYFQESTDRFSGSGCVCGGGVYPVRGSRASGHAPNELEVALLHRRRERIRAILALRVGIRPFLDEQLHLGCTYGIQSQNVSISK